MSLACAPTTSPAPAAARRPGAPVRVLFVAEGVTLAHVGRPMVLARGLDRGRYHVSLAVDQRHHPLLAGELYEVHGISSIPSEQFLEALARGVPVYNRAQLEGYVRADLALIERLAPDVVVGDFRLSLLASCALAGKPYLNITNAYWSPHAVLRTPMPEHALARALGPGAAGVLFRMVRPLIYAAHARPMNQVLKAHGLPVLPADMRHLYTAGDRALFADVPELVRLSHEPATQRFLGPILWSPPVAPPTWWHSLPTDQPIIYVTLGSSGPGELLAVVLDALAPLPVRVIAASAGRTELRHVPANAHVAAYLDGVEAARRARLVICNGGSPTTHQALAAGAPVLALPTNLDQYLNMVGVEHQGAGRSLRSAQAHAGNVRQLAGVMLEDDAYTRAAGRLAQAMARYDPPARLARVIDEVMDARAG